MVLSGGAMRGLSLLGAIQLLQNLKIHRIHTHGDHRDEWYECGLFLKIGSYFVLA